MRRRLVALAAVLVVAAVAAWAGARYARPVTALVEVPAASVPAPLAYPALPEADVRSVILLVGDGMSLANLTAARLHALGRDGRLRLERLPVTGLVTTHSADNLVTKSDAAATALASGRKTLIGRVGTDVDGKPLVTLLEAARARGKSAGLVTTSEIVDATPAAFAAHVPRRDQRAEIARQLVESGVEVLLGGGRRHFLPRSRSGSARADESDLLAAARAAGYAVATAPGDLAAAPAGKLLGLFWEGTSPYTDGQQPTLPAMAEAALARLAPDPDGFFLLIEEEGTDTRAHENDFEETARAVLRFDEAVAVAADFAARDGHTLVVVTADHDTGGLALTRQVQGRLEVVWTTDSHAGEPVPLFAYGPGALRLTGLHDNTDIPQILGELLGLGAWRTL